MGNKNSKIIKYDLKVIFYGNIPNEITRNIENNQEISNINNEYFYYEKYKWYIYLRLNNNRISTINDIENIIKNKLPSQINPRKIFKKNVIISFSPIEQAISLLQHYQTEFFSNNNIEDDIPYFIFNKLSLKQNNQNNWDIRLLINEEKEIINISATNQNLQIYQTDFFYGDFLKCKIFKNYNTLRDIFIKLQGIIDQNKYFIRINKNTEKLEIYFLINQQQINDGDLDELNNENNEINTDADFVSNDEIKSEEKSEIKKITKLKSTQKNNTKIMADDYGALLIVEQNIFIHVSIIDLLEENQRAFASALLDAANYYNYLPLIIDENKTSFNSFNIMLVGKSQSGKSILMNKIAGKNITQSNQGNLRTEDIYMREICNGKINLYDTCGPSNYYLPSQIYSNLKEKIELLNKNGEKIDLLLIVIKRGEMPDEYVFEHLIIKLIQLNLNYLIVINYHERVINSIRKLIKDAFINYGWEIDDDKIVDVNILRDITPLYKKIFELFRSSRITSQIFQDRNFKKINNLSRYSRNNNLLLYKDISWDNIFKRKNWEAEKLYSKYLIKIIGTNVIPIANFIYPFYLTIEFISSLNNIYFGKPLFSHGFFKFFGSFFRNIRKINNKQRTKLLRVLGEKTGLKFFVKLGVGFGTKALIKIGSGFLALFPGVGILVGVIIGEILDIPTFKNDYKLAKEEYLEKLKSKPNNILKKIVKDYNDSINYFGRRADIDINQNDYNIPIEEEEINNIINEDELIELLDFNE